jgi:hypothetical protein
MAFSAEYLKQWGVVAKSLDLDTRKVVVVVEEVDEDGVISEKDVELSLADAKIEGLEHFALMHGV